MDILIKGMEMPKNCCDCVFSDIVPGEVWCKQALEIVTADQALNKTKRPYCCPLVPVPPHGRLIDADAILSEAKRLSGPITGDGWDNYGVYALIERQPAIIPAEEG